MSNCIVSTLIIKNRHIKRNLKLSVLVTARALSCQATLYTVMGCTVSFFGRGRCFCHGDVDTVSSTAFYWIWKVVLFFLFSVRRMRCRALRDAALPLWGMRCALSPCCGDVPLASKGHRADVACHGTCSAHIGLEIISP